MGEISFEFIRRTQGEEAARTAEEKLQADITEVRQSTIMQELYFDADLPRDYDYDPLNPRQPIYEEQLLDPVYILGHVSINDLQIPEIAHRDHWPEVPEIDPELRYVAFVYCWGQSRSET